MADSTSPSSSGLPDRRSSADTLVVFTTVFIPIQVIAVSLRYLARWKLKAWGFDDYIILASLTMQMAVGAVSIAAVNYAGVGHHVPYLEATDPEKLVIWSKYLIVVSVLYFAGVNIPKLAILVLYHRLFPSRRMKIIIYIVMAVLLMSTLSNVIIDLAACRPFNANWDLTVRGATCIDKEAFFVLGSVPNILTDIVMLILPMPTVWKLHANRRLKIGLTVTFTFGSFGMITAIIRFATFLKTNSFTDGTFAAVELLIWTQVEAGVYLICACIPTYKVLLEQLVAYLKSPLVQTIRGNTSQSRSLSRAYGSHGVRDEQSSVSDIPLRDAGFGMSAASHAWSQLEDETGKQGPGIMVTTNIHVKGQATPELRR